MSLRLVRACSTALSNLVLPSPEGTRSPSSRTPEIRNTQNIKRTMASNMQTRFSSRTIWELEFAGVRIEDTQSDHLRHTPPHPTPCRRTRHSQALGNIRVTGVVGEFTQAMVVRAAAGGFRHRSRMNGGHRRRKVGQRSMLPAIQMPTILRVAFAPMKLQDVLILSRARRRSGRMGEG